MSAPEAQFPKNKFRLFFSCLIALACLLAAFPSTAAAGDGPVVIYVDGSASGSYNGESWGNAFTDLQDALNAAGSHIPGKKVEIWVAEGTYKPTDDGDRTKSFVLSNGIALYGGFSGTETARKQRKPAENHTTLSGAIDGGQKSYHVVYADGVNETAILDGFTITGGNANDDDTNKDGGGMYIQDANSKPTLMNCTFSENSAADGDGIYINSGTPTVKNTIFWGTDSAAGQVVDLSANLTITYSVTDLSGQGNTNADPELDPLADNGGPTLTCALLEGSPAIDSGTGSGAPKRDQRGVPRPQGGGVDMGAYERAPEQPESPEGSGGGGCSAGPASPWTLALLAPLAPLALRRRAGRRGR